MILYDFKKTDETALSDKTMFFIISTFLTDLEGEQILRPTNFLRRFAIACIKHLSFKTFSKMNLTTQEAFSLFNEHSNSKKVVEYREQQGAKNEVWFHIEKR